MSFGVPTALKTQLNSTQVGGVFYLVQLVRTSSTKYIAERSITWSGNTYEARLLSVSGLRLSIVDATTIEIVLGNTDGAVTSWDQTESFFGAKVNIYEYVLSLDGTVADAYLKWTGISDEIVNIDLEKATLKVYSGPVTLRLETPKRSVGTQCTHLFANFTTSTSEIHAADETTRNFEGFECPYGKDVNTGFTANLNANMNATTSPITFDVTWGATPLANGAKFQKGDLVGIDSEILEITNYPADPTVGGIQTITCNRGIYSTTLAAHTAGNNNVKFKSCGHSWTDCARRGMRGNNPNDVYSGTKRNYFGGFPLITISDIKRRPVAKGISPGVGSTVGAFGSPLPLIYGNVLLSEPTFYIVSDQNSFLTTAWLLGEGVFATNATDDTLNADPLFAFGGYTGIGGTENIFVNNKRRHDTRTNFGIEVWLGDRDRQPPSTSAFFSTTTVPMFSTDKLAFWGTGWLLIKIAKENNETVDVNSNISAEIEIKYGRIVRTYLTAPSGSQDANDPTLFTRKATTNPAWVLLDFETAKRGGGGIDYRQFDIQSFIDLASYCSGIVTDVTNPNATATRYTFNGAVGNKRSIQDYERSICLGMYCTPPFLTVNGKLKVKALKKENPISGSVPFFSDKSGTTSERNIIWDNGRTTLVKTKKSILDIPNRIIVNYAVKDAVSGKWLKTTGMIEDQHAQQRIGTILGDNSIRVVSKTIELIGVTTDDQAARTATLILRAGELAEGGLSNNQIITFQCGYKTANDVAIGDIIEVQSDLLSISNNEQFYRIINIEDEQAEVTGHGFIFKRKITASLHLESIYDDSSGALTTLSTTTNSSAKDGLAPSVTGASVVEAGIFDNNNKMMAELTFTYTEPAVLDNYKNVSIWRSNLANPNLPYDPVTNIALDDWRHVGELRKSGDKVQWGISGKYEVFTLLSRNLYGNTPDPKTKTADGTAFYYPRLSALVAGVTNTISVPTGFQLFLGSNLVTLQWTKYTGIDLQLFKSFRVYRNTVDVFSSATKIAELDGTLFVDTSVNSSTLYYYWITGFTLLHTEGSPTNSLNTTSPANAGTDGGLPTAPIIGVVRGTGSFNSNEYDFLIGVDKPGGASNWNGVDLTHIQIATDIGFTSLILDRDFQIKPPMTETIKVNTPGTYYFRAYVHNAFGNSANSLTLSRTTHFADNLSADTAIPPAPDNLALVVAAGDPSLSGNEFKVNFEIPNTQTGSYWGYSIYIHDSSVLPTATTQVTGTTGAINAGVSVLTDTNATLTPHAWDGGGYDLVIFDPTRGAIPTFDYEGLMIVGKITNNTATAITFDNPAERQVRTKTGCRWYIVARNAGNHFWEKLKFTTPAIINEGVLALTEERSSRKRTLTFSSGISTLYVWVSLYNLFGQGKVTATPPTATFAGITTSEIKLLAVTTGLLADSAVTSGKIASGAVIASKLTRNAQSFNTNIVFSANNNNTVAWTSGVIKFADGTTQIINASNTGIMTALTYIYYNNTADLQITTTYSVATGENVVLLCTAQNTADTTQNAFFVPVVGVLGINETSIGPNSISTGKIQASAITTNTIAANAVTATKISVSQLSAISADVGTITAGIVTGATLRTAASGSRIEMDSTNGLRAYNTGGVVFLQIPVSGITSGYLLAQQIQGQSGALSLSDSTGTAGGNISVASTQLTFSIGGTGKFLVDATGPQAINTNLRFNSGFGIASGGTSFACALNAEIYQSSILQMSFNGVDAYVQPGTTLRFGTHTAIGVETVTGYITVKDASGISRKLAVVS